MWPRPGKTHPRMAPSGRNDVSDAASGTGCFAGSG
jgi:hypothetical protein